MAAIRYDEGGGEHPPALRGSVRHALRIANCSGFYGDRFSAPREMLEGGPIDVLTGEYLAELTMLILWKARVKDPDAGYATTFLRQMEDVAGLAIDRGVKIVVNAGADIVVCPRVTDASLVVGPAAWRFGWARDDWDLLAGAVVAGHIIECGPQATGGNYSFFSDVPGMTKLGFPIAEVREDGSSV